jgi:hypothetical protein
MTDNMVRVVAQDGTVWWVNPDSADYYRTLTQEIVDGPPVDPGFDLYWRNQEHDGGQ